MHDHDPAVYLNKLAIAALNPMQEAMLAAFDQSDHLVLISPTGSGKTLGYLLPILNSLNPEAGQIQAMVISPSRELAIQIERVFKTMSTGFKANCFYGGHPIKVERDSLSQPPALLVGTPGRIADHLRRQTFVPDSISILVFDEFDKSLELGFEDDIRFITEQLHGVRKQLLISATKMTLIPDFLRIDNALELNFEKKDDESKLKLKLVRAEGKDKLETLFRLLCLIGNKSTLVFCNHRMAVDRISQLLGSQKIAHDVYHGGLKQEEREQALAKFRNGTYSILLSTDLAGRGLDIPAIEHVVHYQLAGNLHTYIHRNGRTARMHADGSAYILLTEDEHLPEYIDEEPEPLILPEQPDLPANPQWMTLRFGAGKKEKISKGDIAGFLMQKGLLNKEEIGLIEIYDFVAYAAVKASKASDVVENIRNEKIKKKKIQISLSW